MALLRPEEYRVRIEEIDRYILKSQELEKKVLEEDRRKILITRRGLDSFRFSFDRIYEIVKLPRAKVLYDAPQDKLPAVLKDLLAVIALENERREVLIEQIIDAYKEDITITLEQERIIFEGRPELLFFLHVDHLEKITG